MEKRRKLRQKEEKHFFITTWTSLSSLVLLTLIVALSSGCMGAIPLMMAAHAGIVAHSVTKAVQMSTDGSVEMAIGENEIPTKNKLVLAKISRIAVWPDEGLVVVADELQKSKVFDFIATPARTGRILDDNTDFGHNIASLTYSEKMSAFETVCVKTSTEAIIVFENLGVTANSRMWSFNRASLDSKGKILIFELRSNQIVFSSITEMSIGLGGSSPNQREMMAKAGKMLAQRIIELKTGQTVAQK